MRVVILILCCLSVQAALIDLTCVEGQPCQMECKGSNYPMRIMHDTSKGRYDIVTMFTSRFLVRWADKERVTWDDTKKIMTIIPLPTDGGRYICAEGKGKTHIVSYEVTLTPASTLPPPTVKDVICQEKKTCVLPCTYVGQETFQKMTWTSGGGAYTHSQILNPFGRYSTWSFEMKATYIGHWTCYGNGSEKALINTGTLTMTLTQHERHVFVGQQVVLPCNMGRTVHYLGWNVDAIDSSISFDGHFDKTENPVTFTATSGHTGIYTCELTPMEGATAIPIATYKVEVTVSLIGWHCNETTRCALPCTAFPAAKLKYWWRNGAFVGFEGSYNTESTLIYASVTVDQKGYHECKNKNGVSMAKYNLTITPAPTTTAAPTTTTAPTTTAPTTIAPTTTPVVETPKSETEKSNGEIGGPYSVTENGETENGDTNGDDGVTETAETPTSATAETPTSAKTAGGNTVALVVCLILFFVLCIVAVLVFLWIRHRRLLEQSPCWPACWLKYQATAQEDL